MGHKKKFTNTMAKVGHKNMEIKVILFDFFG